MPRTVFVFALLLAITITGGVAFWISSDHASGQSTTTVNVGDFYFCDPSFSGSVCDTNINAGDTVTWQWVGSATHTVTECDPTFTTCPLPGGFASVGMSSGTFSQTFNTPGSFEYRCNFHPTQMHGRINVAALQATPTATAGPTTTVGATPSGAQTTAAVRTTAPAPVRSAAPAAVPQTGGDPGYSGLPWAVLMAAAGLALTAAAGAFSVRLLRRL